MQYKKDVKGIINSMGLVFGDIGTSPIYTLAVIFFLTAKTYDHILGIISLIIWTLITLVTLEYAWLAMSLGKKGEGGTVVLKELLTPLLKNKKQISTITLLSYIGISFLLADGVITPAMTILSAVEGFKIVPGLELINQSTLIIIASIIAILLFSIQKKGTEKIAWLFGPFMVIWFSVLFLSGLLSIVYTPSIFIAINPLYAIDFLTTNGIEAFIVLSEVILCATGGEALYADMGHLGKEPIQKAWSIVFVCLVINYLGQGAFLIRNPSANNVLFEMIYNQAAILFVPFLILSIIASIIASQAMISGVFSIVYQAITTRIIPYLKVDYTSNELKSQIYIGSINLALMIAVLFMIFIFRASTNLAAAYGLTVTVSMTITGIMMTLIFALRKNWLKASVALFVTFIDILFLLSNIYYKLPHGGYWTLTFAFVLCAHIIIYTAGQQKLYQLLKPRYLNDFLDLYNKRYKAMNKINGSAVYFARSINTMPQYIYHVMFENDIIYEDNIIVSINSLEEPFGVKSYFGEDLGPGLRLFKIDMGYMELIDLTYILKKAGIEEKTIFYGVEEITTNNPIWQIFALIKKISPSFVQYYKLPSQKLHGVISRFEM